MKLANVIKAEDLQNLQVDENGDYIIPEGIKIYVQEDKLDLINELNDLLKIEVPSIEELIELGKSIHPYYDAQIRVNEIKSKIN